jgi:hypothetical protein
MDPGDEIGARARNTRGEMVAAEAAVLDFKNSRRFNASAS